MRLAGGGELMFYQIDGWMNVGSLCFDALLLKVSERPSLRSRRIEKTEESCHREML